MLYSPRGYGWEFNTVLNLGVAATVRGVAQTVPRLLAANGHESRLRIDVVGGPVKN